MNKTVTAVLAISALAVNVAGATSNNTLGGTNNTISATSTSSAVWGFQNNIDANNALAFGTNNTVTGENGFAGGNNSKATGRNSLAYGSHAEALVEYTVAIGSQARTTAYDTIAIGNGAYANGESTVVIGRTNTVNAENATVIGSNNGTVGSGHGVVVGYNNQVLDNSKEQLVFGSNSESSGQGALVFGTHAKSLATDAVAFGNNTIADRANAVAIGTNSVTDDAVGVDGVDLNGTRHIFAGEQPGAVVSFGSKARTGAGGVAQYNRQLQNVSAGRVEADSLDAVNGSQLYAAYDEINTLGGKVSEHDQQINRNTNSIGTINSRINRIDIGISTNTKDIADLKDKIDRNTIAIRNELNNKINATEQRINRLGASSAALAGLHPLEFNKNDKVSYAVSYGHYRNSNAVALGVFARPNERLMIGVGATLGAENQYNVSVSFKTGRGADYVAEAKDAQSRISKLEALVAKLMAEVEK